MVFGACFSGYASALRCHNYIYSPISQTSDWSICHSVCKGVIGWIKQIAYNKVKVSLREFLSILETQIASCFSFSSHCSSNFIFPFSLSFLLCFHHHYDSCLMNVKVIPKHSWLVIYKKTRRWRGTWIIRLFHVSFHLMHVAHVLCH